MVGCHQPRAISAGFGTALVGQAWISSSCVGLRRAAQTKAHRSKVSRLLKVWIETGMFAVVERKGDKGRPRDFVEVGQHA